MRVTLVCLGLSMCLALALGERCTTEAQCGFETCIGDGWSVSCVVGECTCEHGTHTGAQCVTVQDCGQMDCHLANGIDRFLHPQCRSGHCRCGFSIGGGGIGK